LGRELGLGVLLVRIMGDLGGKKTEELSNINKTETENEKNSGWHNYKRNQEKKGKGGGSPNRCPQQYEKEKVEKSRTSCHASSLKQRRKTVRGKAGKGSRTRRTMIGNQKMTN